MTNSLKKRILVVDDDFKFRELLSEVLSEAGYFVETAENGNDALQKLNSDCCNLIISETYMSVMDGMELYQNIINIAPWFKKRFLFVTDRITFETVCFFAKNDLRYMLKPIRALDLLCLIDEILKEKLSSRDASAKITNPELEGLQQPLIEA